MPLPCPQRGSRSCVSWFVLLVVLFLACFVTSGGLVASAQNASKRDRAAAESLTQSLMELHAEYRAAAPGERSELLLQMRSLAAERQQLLSSLIQTSPAEVLRVAIPGHIAAALPASVQRSLEQETDTQGQLEVIYEDGKNSATLHHYVKTGGQRLELKFAANVPTNLLTGATVHVHGTRVGNVLALGSGKNKGNINPVSPPPAVNTLGAQNTLVILVNFKDLSTQPYTVAGAQSVMFGTSGSVSSWELENSLQQTWLTGDVAGWFTIQVSSTTCDTTSIASDAQSAAQAAGYNLSNYSHYMYVFPYTSACGWGGLATVGGPDSWYNGTLDIELAAHELGHNFGLYHSHNLNCGTTVLCSNGSVGEYGDAFDVMGAAYSGHYNSYQKERLGWLNSGASPPITTVTASGTYDIGAYETQDSTAKALKILQSSSSSSYYYVEFRQPIGFDSFVTAYSDVVGGVVVHLASPSNVNSSEILDMTPTSPATFFDPGLIVGQSYQDATAGVTITPVSVGSTASVQVTLAGATCTHANPSLTMSPSQSAWVASGTTESFTATLSNNDNSACSSSSFNLAATGLPSGWSSSFGSSALILAPGASSSTTLQVTSPVGTVNGFYSFTTTAASGGYSASASATYVISTSTSITMSVSTDKASYSGGQTVTITATVLSGGSPDVGASVSVSITSPRGSVTSLSGTTGSNGTAVLGYTLRNKATAGTYQVQASTTASGASTTTAANTTFSVQ